MGGTARPDEERAAPGSGNPGSIVVEQGTLFGHPVRIEIPRVTKELQLSQYERYLLGVPIEGTA